jgi:hypothetical protein
MGGARVANWETKMGDVLSMVCVECRERQMIGDIYFSDSTQQWRIDRLPGRQAEEDTFLLAHRGHVLGLVDSPTLDIASDSDDIESTFTVDEIRSRHRMLEDHLENDDYLARPTELMAKLLRIPPGEVDRVNRLRSSVRRRTLSDG